MALRMLDLECSFWDFDEASKIHDGLLESIAEWMAVTGNRSKRSKGTVVDLVPEIRKKEVLDRRRWLPTKEDIDRVAADIWPGVHGPAPKVSSVKGKATKKPALSYEAKHALSEIEGQLEMIKFQMRRLSERSLTGLEFEANRTATFEDPELWLGIAGEAKRQREILAAHRTGKGEWYAVVEATITDSPIAERSVASAHERCATRAKAIEAAKRLLIDKADWLGPQTRIDASICSGLEWIDEDK